MTEGAILKLIMPDRPKGVTLRFVHRPGGNPNFTSCVDLQMLHELFRRDFFNITGRDSELLK